jgi:hypothetical protein
MRKASFLCAWFLGRHAQQTLLLVTFSDSVAREIAAEVQTIVASKWYRDLVAETRIDSNGSDAAFLCKIRRGVFVPASLGADIFVIDGLCDDNRHS